MLRIHGELVAAAHTIEHMIRFIIINDFDPIVDQFAEILGGYIAGSLAIMSDAAHLLSDCISFIVALMAICVSKKSPDNYMTFGYKRVGKCFSVADDPIQFN